MMAGVFHGGGLDVAIEKYGGEKADWLDLSTGINPNPYPVYGVDGLAWSRLPDTKAMDILLNAARAYYGVKETIDLLAANGTQALIEMLPHALKAKRIGIVSPTYNEHANVWSKAGTQVIEVSNLDDLPDDLDGLVVVNPNNPTANIYSIKQLIAASDTLNARGGFMIVDEAFCDTAPQNSVVAQLPDNVIVLKSFGKFFGLAGLRLGFAIAQPKMLTKLQLHIGPWSVSGPALQIGARAFADKDWIGYAITVLNALSAKQSSLLKEIGLTVVGVNPLFVYTSHANASDICEKLTQKHILVRPFLQKPEFIRFGICANNEQLQRLKLALEEIM